ncbi:hypothetical protein M2105_001233 [Paenibacillus sp. PastF-1]|nr:MULTISPECIES: hypothetical protein [unclassified Paenibacillus]MDF9840234.1 hypothetical protein [Paenibacillus sp. PastF-2]MDF9846816.1 hypothetical protein [Paenibacillus sp. PastM-2]MDF9853388.1 hypothetical protein [Paenibacillus sp. PastF-1]MDH6506856.1 hypothetical protein [Paenibacillus sp. PastM-3]
MGILKAAQRLVFILIAGVVAASCSEGEGMPVHTKTDLASSDIRRTESAQEPTGTQGAEPFTVSTPGQRQEAWEDYLNSVVERREEYLFFTEQRFEIHLQDRVKQGEITLVNDSEGFSSIEDSYVSAYLIDIDKDGLDELYVITVEGSIRQYYGHIYRQKGEMYTRVDTFEGNIIPYECNNDIHFLDVVADFETKFTSAVIEYEADGLAFKPVKTLEVHYTYDVSELPEPWSKVISSAELNTLHEYELLRSPDATVTKLTEQPAYDIQVTDDKNSNTFRFTVQLWLTTVGYAPNYWEIFAADEGTQHFKGIEQIDSDQTSGTKGAVNYGLKFYKDAASGQLFLLKISYPFFTMETRKDGDLMLEIFRFNEKDAEKIDEVLLEPNVEIIAE